MEIPSGKDIGQGEKLASYVTNNTAASLEVSLGDFFNINYFSYINLGSSICHESMAVKKEKRAV